MGDVAGGDEVRLLLLHGYFSGSIAWGRVRQALDRPGIRILAPDHLGYGRFRRRRQRPYTIEALAQHLRPAVEGFRPTHIVGHSMGGLVAMALDRQFPGRFHHIGIVGLPVFADPIEGKLHQAQRGRRFAIFMRTHAFSHAGCVVLDRTRNLWAGAAIRYAPQQPAEVLRTVFEHNLDSHKHGLLAIAFGGLIPDLAGGVCSPVSLLHGSQDRTAPLERARDLADQYAWDFEIADGANHQVIVERPLVVANWIERRVLGRGHDAP